MFIKFKENFRWVFPLMLALSLFALPASALDLAQAKAQGLVQETASGYLKVVKPTGAAGDLVKKINAGRKAEYQKIAKKRGTSLTAVEQLAGKRLTQ